MGKPASDDFAQGGEVRLDIKKLLRSTAVRAGSRSLPHQKSAVRRSVASCSANLRENRARAGRNPYCRQRARQSRTQCDRRLPERVSTRSRSLNGRARWCRETTWGHPRYPGRLKRRDRRSRLSPAASPHGRDSSLQIYSDVASGEAARQTNALIRGFGAGIDQADHLD